MVQREEGLNGDVPGPPDARGGLPAPVPSQVEAGTALAIAQSTGPASSLGAQLIHHLQELSSADPAPVSSPRARGRAPKASHPTLSHPPHPVPSPPFPSHTIPLCGAYFFCPELLLRQADAEQGPHAAQQLPPGPVPDRLEERQVLVDAADSEALDLRGDTAGSDPPRATAGAGKGRAGARAGGLAS